MAATAHSLLTQGDTRSAQASAQLDRVAGRIRDVRARTRALSNHIAELTRQFLDDALVEQSGPGKGRPLAREGRIEWLSRLAKLHRSYCTACDEEAHLQALLRRLEESVEGVPALARCARDGRPSPARRH